MRFLLLFFVVLSSCVTRSPRASVVETKPDWVVEGCGPDRDFPWKAGDVVLFGEIHGTAEIPAFVSLIACRALQRGIPVRIGMESYKEEQERLDAFVSSGDKATQDALLQGEFWTRPVQDGRSSIAHFGLIQWAQRAKKDKQKIDVYSFDSERSQQQAERENNMANQIIEQQKQAPEALHLILVGNFHARTKVGAPWDPSLVWMGVLLAKALPSLTALNVSYSNGEAWVCFGSAAEDCEVSPMKGTPAADPSTQLSLFETPDENGYHGVFFVGELHSSLPAVTK